MGYPKNFNPDKYGDLLPMLNKALMLPPNGKIKFRVKTGSPRTAGYKCRQFFHLNPTIGPREYSVRVGQDCPDLDDNIIEIIKMAGVDFGVEELD